MNPYEQAWKRLEPIWDELLNTAANAPDGHIIHDEAKAVEAFLDGALATSSRHITLEAAAGQLKAMFLETLGAYEALSLENANYFTDEMRHRFEVLKAKTDAAGLLLDGGAK